MSLLDVFGENLHPTCHFYLCFTTYVPPVQSIVLSKAWSADFLFLPGCAGFDENFLRSATLSHPTPHPLPPATKSSNPVFFCLLVLWWKPEIRSVVLVYARKKSLSSNCTCGGVVAFFLGRKQLVYGISETNREWPPRLKCYTIRLCNQSFRWEEFLDALCSHSLPVLAASSMRTLLKELRTALAFLLVFLTALWKGSGKCHMTIKNFMLHQLIWLRVHALESFELSNWRRQKVVI